MSLSAKEKLYPTMYEERKKQLLRNKNYEKLVELLLKEIKPNERVRPCPNCGELKRESQLGHSAIHRGIADFCISTLYGVCLNCARIHDNTGKYKKSTP